jgi:hypothetical protein
VLLAAGPQVDPAVLVTAEDAGRALGEPVGPARPLLERPLPVGELRACQYLAASGDHASVSVFTAAGDVIRMLARVNRSFGSAVPGIGDEAYLRNDTIAVLRGDVAVSIRLRSRKVPDRAAALRELATVAVGRL